MKDKVLISLLITLLLTIGSIAKSQVLISLLLGDKLNNGNIEFGLDGGINWLNISNTPGAKNLLDWNLGFYFDFKMKNPNLFIHTGVLVKSKMGTKNLTPYSVENDSLDAIFSGGTVERKINYFNVPVMLRYRFFENFHVEGGVQLGLRYTGYDIFYNDVNSKEDLKFQYDVKNNFKRIDAGGVAGLGYKFNKGQGLILSVRYYHGFIDADKILQGNQYLSALYINASIPIGKAKAERKAAEKAREIEPLK